MRTAFRKVLPVCLALCGTLTACASTAQAQQRRNYQARRPSYSRGSQYSALNNQMMSMFNAQQARNWAMVGGGYQRRSSPYSINSFTPPRSGYTGYSSVTMRGNNPTFTNRMYDPGTGFSGGSTFGLTPRGGVRSGSYTGNGYGGLGSSFNVGR